jgi:hypothetical protein
MNKRRKYKTEILLSSEIEMLPVPIVSDALVASRDVADGRALPVLIIDTSSRSDIEDMIKIHKQIRTGDVRSIWSLNSKDKNVLNLTLSFENPSKCVVVLEFDIIKYFGLIDQIMHMYSFYLHYGRKGERYINTMDRENIIVEVPSTHFFKEWDKLLRQALIKNAKKEFKLSRADAKERTEKLISECREIFSKRKK